MKKLYWMFIVVATVLGSGCCTSDINLCSSSGYTVRNSTCNTCNTCSTCGYDVNYTYSGWY